MPASHSQIVVQNLAKWYPFPKKPLGFQALKNISFTVAQNEIFGVIGESGSGKSTLIRCLSGLESVFQGSIEIGGERLVPAPSMLHRIRKKIGMIFQNFNLFHSKTVLQNVLFPLELGKGSRREQLKKAESLLALVGLNGKEGAYPAQLSGGQKQRVAIARALTTDPRILFCDECTSALDPSSTQSILRLLLELSASLGLTIVMVTHQMDVIKQLCSRAAVLENGEIVEIGSVADLFCSPAHPATCRLVTCEIPECLRQGGLLRLKFRGRTAYEPIIWQMTSRFKVSVNILLGGIDALQTGIIGSLIVEIAGDEEEKKKALEFLKQKEVNIEVVGR